MTQKLLETVADISYLAGVRNYYSGDSRFDISLFLSWAREFEELHKHTDWDNENYMLAIDSFTEEKLLSDLSTLG
jgi:hypothetical protein